jgi:hypothetical protein
MKKINISDVEIESYESPEGLIHSGFGKRLALRVRKSVTTTHDGEE